MNKWLSIQALRGFAVLGVVAFHTLTIEQKYSDGDILLPDFFRLGQAGVDLFFVISGFVMVTVTRGRFGGNGETLRFLWGRFTRIYPTYWFYFILTAAVFLVKPGWVNAAQGHRADLFASFFLLPSHQLPVVMVAWSLIHELWFYLVFSVLLKFEERLLLPWLLVWGTCIILVNLLMTTNDASAIVRLVSHPYSLEFILGALAAIFLYSGLGKSIPLSWALSMLVCLLAAGMPLVYMSDVLLNADLLRAAFVGSLFGLLLISLTTVEKGSLLSVPKAMQFMGDISYSVYLSHVLALSAIGRIWRMAAPVPDSLADNLFAALVMLAVVVVSGWLGYRCIERPILQISHCLRMRWFDQPSRHVPVAIDAQIH